MAPYQSIRWSYELQKLLCCYRERCCLHFWKLFWQWWSFQIQVRILLVDRPVLDRRSLVFIFNLYFRGNKWSLHGQTFKYYGQTSVAKGLQVMHIGTFDGTSTRAQYWEMQYDDTFAISESDTVFDNWYVPYIWFYWIKNCTINLKPLKILKCSPFEHAHNCLIDRNKQLTAR